MCHHLNTWEKIKKSNLTRPNIRPKLTMLHLLKINHVRAVPILSKFNPLVSVLFKGLECSLSVAIKLQNARKSLYLDMRQSIQE